MGFFKLIDLTSFYFTANQYTSSVYTIIDLYNNGYTVDQLYECGYTINEIYDISALKPPISIGTEFFKSKIDITYRSNNGLSNGLDQIINTTNYPLGPIFTYYTDPLNNHKSYEIQRIFQLYSIFDLYYNENTGLGFGISFMKYNNIPIQTLYPLVTKDIIQFVNLKNGDQLNGFDNIRYTLLELYLLLYSITNNSTNTIFNMYESFQYSIRNFYDSSFTTLQMKNSGIYINEYINKNPDRGLIPINPRTLFNAGYTLFDLFNAGYTDTEFYSSGFNVSEFITAGFTISQIKSIFGNIIISDYINYKASLKNLLDASYTIIDIYPYRNNYTISEFINNGFSIQQLYDASFTFYDLYNGYITNGIPTINQILNLHYNISEIIPYDISIPLYYNSNYSSFDLFNNGFIINFLKNNYSLSMFKQDLIPLYSLYTSGYYTFSDYSNNGYILNDYFNSNIPLDFINDYYSVYQLLSVGYNKEQIISLHFYPVSDFYKLNYPALLLINYYTIDELLKGGYSRFDLNIEGNNIAHYCCTKKNILYTQPSVLGSSMNQTRSSSKMNYSKQISSRIGGSYNTSYSDYLNNTNTQGIPALCVDSFTSKTTASAAKSTPCRELNIPIKTAGAFSYFIRNYIANEIKLYNTVPENSKIITDSEIANIYNQIDISLNNFPNIPIYTIIKDLLFPTKKIISGPF